ncbi:MAG: hypothetical protein H0V91_15155 [Flavisolibacter sp.]|nr:hypothetical protein [Flavisolibacter sp.]
MIGKYILSGANEDGAAGLAAVKEAGGFVAIQDQLLQWFLICRSRF